MSNKKSIPLKQKSLLKNITNEKFGSFLVTFGMVSILLATVDTIITASTIAFTTPHLISIVFVIVGSMLIKRLVAGLYIFNVLAAIILFAAFIFVAINVFMPYFILVLFTGDLRSNIDIALILLYGLSVTGIAFVGMRVLNSPHVRTTFR